MGEENFKENIQSRFDKETIFNVQDSHRVRYFAPLNIDDTSWYVQSAMSLDIYNEGKNQLLVALITAEVILFILLQLVLFTALKKSLQPLGKLAEEVISWQMETSILRFLMHRKMKSVVW